MAGVYLMASRPGAFTKEGLILANPEARADGITPSAGAWGGTPDLEVPAAAKPRLLSVVTDEEIWVLQLSENETTSDFEGVPTTVVAPVAGQTSYACLLHPSTVAVYVRTP